MMENMEASLDTTYPECKMDFKHIKTPRVRILHSSGWPQIPYVAEVGLELLILLLSSPTTLVYFPQFKWDGSETSTLSKLV